MTKIELEGSDIGKGVLLISTDHKLKDAIENIEGVTFVRSYTELVDGIDCDVVMLDGRDVKLHTLKSVRNTYPKAIILYQPDGIPSYQQTKNMTAVCGAHDIHLLSEHLLPTQVSEEIEKRLFNRETSSGNRVIGFFGTHSGAGVSTTLFNVADILSRKIQERVLVLSLNPYDPGDYLLPYNGMYLNDLKVDLKMGQLTQEKLMEAACDYENFSHLAGNRDIKLQRYYKPKEIQHLIEVAKEAYDVVLLDSGAHFDNACYAQSYKSSELKFLLTSQEPKGYLGYWPHIFHQLLEPIGSTTEDFLLIINQYREELTSNKDTDIRDSLNMEVLTTINQVPLYGEASVTQKKLLHEASNNKSYISSITSIANSIISQAGLTLNPGEELVSEKKGIFGFLKRKSS